MCKLIEDVVIHVERCATKSKPLTSEMQNKIKVRLVGVKTEIRTRYPSSTTVE